MINDSFYNYQIQLQGLLLGIDTNKLEDFCNLLNEIKHRDFNIFIIGNGGSAATASHFANDLRTQLGVKAISLTDISALTCIGNDFGYENVFSDQLKVLSLDNDIVIGISASGNSPNIVNALKYANENNLLSLSIVGFDGGNCYKLSKCSVLVKSDKGLYRLVEDCHSIICHFIIDYLVGIS